MDAQKFIQLVAGGEDSVEVQDTADSEIEEDELLTQEEFDALSEEDQELYLEALEQLDEVSQKTAVKAYSARLGREDDDTGNTKSMKTMEYKRQKSSQLQSIDAIYRFQ